MTLRITDRRQLKVPVDSPKMLPFGVALLSLSQQAPSKPPIRMVTDQQVRRLFMLIHQEPTLAIAAVKAGMDEKIARKYRRLGKLPSEVKQPHTWRTRKDPFAKVWDEPCVNRGPVCIYCPMVGFAARGCIVTVSGGIAPPAAASEPGVKDFPSPGSSAPHPLSWAPR